MTAVWVCVCICVSPPECPFDRGQIVLGVMGNLALPGHLDAIVELVEHPNLEMAMTAVRALRRCVTQRS